MRKVLSLIFTLIIISQFVLGQKEVKHGQLRNEVPDLLAVKDLSKVVYSYYGEPQIPKKLDSKKFSLNHVNTVETLVQSYLLANSVEWRLALSEDKELKVLDEKQQALSKFLIKKEKPFVEICARLKFSTEANDYEILLVKYEYQDGFYSLFPFPCVKSQDKWLISSDPEIIEFGTYLFVSPELFKNVFKVDRGLPSKQVESFRNNFLINGKYFRVDLGFGFKAFMDQFSSDQSFSELILDKNHLPKVDVSISKSGTGFIGFSSMITLSAPKQYVYKDEFQISKDEGNNEMYSLTPEKALSSWVFSNDSQRKLNSKNYELINEFSLDLTNPHGVVKYHQKFIFNTESGLYCLLYVRLITGYVDEEGNSREKTLGDFRFLLKWEDNKWVADFGAPKTLRQFVCFIDKFDLTILSEIFKGNVTDTEILSFLAYINYDHKSDHINVSSVVNNFQYYQSRMPQKIKVRRGIENKYPEIFSFE